MATESPTQPLLTPDFIAKIEQLQLVSRKIFMGRMRGERRSRRRGESVEFADYRNYVVGDDLRHIDWNIYARLEKLFLKLFLEEEDLHVSLLIDTSRSMDWGTPTKSLYARRVAAAVGYIGLANLDRVSFYAYANGLEYELAGLRGRRWLPRAIDFLTRMECDSVSNMSLACRQFAIRHPQAGIVILLSDFFEKGGYEQGLRYLMGRKYDIYCIQMLSPEEIDPPLAGDLQLKDAEDDDLADVTVTRALLNRYRHNLRAYCESLKTFCTNRGINYMFTSTTVPFEQIVLNYFRRRGLMA